MKNKFIIVQVIMLCFVLLLTERSVEASSLARWNVADGIARWSYISSSKPHMGNKDTSYKYKSSAVKSKYQSILQSGINLWGTNVRCLYKATSTIGLIDSVSTNTNYTASTTVNYDSTSKHINSWKLTIASRKFDNNSQGGKTRTIAHEIGHVYGLGHVNHSSQIMYYTYSESKNVSSYDIKGMNIMTHIDVHPAKTVERGTAYHHKVRCNTCKAYLLEVCQHNDYHLGRKHYFESICSCGNTYTNSWSCSGNPHTFPY